MDLLLVGLAHVVSDLWDNSSNVSFLQNNSGE